LTATAMATRYVTDIRVLGIDKNEKKKKMHGCEVSMRVTWNDGSVSNIYRPISMLFDFQSILNENFESKVKMPSIPGFGKIFGKILGRLSSDKECKDMEDYCQQLVNLPPVVSHSELITHFFEQWGTDASRRGSGQDSPAVASSPTQSALGRLQLDANNIFPSTHEVTNAISTTNGSSNTREHKTDEYLVISNYPAAGIGEITLTEGSIVTAIEKNERGMNFSLKKGSEIG